jgi:hypothetical protein
MSDKTIDKASWTEAVIKVGLGRGFVVEISRTRYVITAGHCLPFLPPSAPVTSIEDRTYHRLLGRLGEKETPVWAECKFVDPIADLAVLGCPDNQELADKAKAFQALVEAAVPLPIGRLPLVRSPLIDSGGLPLTVPETGETALGPPTAKASAWLLSLDGHWFQCDLTARHAGLSIEWAAEEIAPSMSGEPIVSGDGEAIGVVCTDGNGNASVQASLSRQLPRWFLDAD